LNWEVEGGYTTTFMAILDSILNFKAHNEAYDGSIPQSLSWGSKTTPSLNI